LSWQTLKTYIITWKLMRTSLMIRIFIASLSTLISDSGKAKTAIVADSCISEPYLYNLLRGEKRPTRNSVIKLAFGLELTLETTERFLMLAGYRSFYERHKRDSLLKYAFLNKYGYFRSGQSAGAVRVFRYDRVICRSTQHLHDIIIIYQTAPYCQSKHPL